MVDRVCEEERKSLECISLEKITHKMSYYYLFWEDTFDKVNYISLNLRYMNKYEWLSIFQKKNKKDFKNI